MTHAARLPCVKAPAIPSRSTRLHREREAPIGPWHGPCSARREESPMTERTSLDRRGFLGAAAATLASAELAFAGTASAQSQSKDRASAPRSASPMHTSFGNIKQIDAGALNVGYVEAGPPTGPAVILLHGWPYDIHSFVDVAPTLASAGYRVIVPYLRGYG